MAYRHGSESEAGPIFRSAFEPPSRREQVDVDAPSLDEMTFDRPIGSLMAFLAVAADISRHTESPIETIFGAVFHREATARLGSLPLVFCQPKDEPRYERDYLLLMPQYSWRRYRIDWAIKATPLAQPYFFVECDGAEFHTSAPQVARDKARDQAIIAAGIRPFRFTGSQLCRKPENCAADVILAIADELRRGGR